MKKIVITGSREFDDYETAKEYIDRILNHYYNNESVTIISGGCRGADLLGEKYALENNLNIEIYKADWSIYKKAAGPIRNKEMVLKSDAVICFWDNKSKGTKSLIELAEKTGKKVYVKIIEIDKE